MAFKISSGMRDFILVTGSIKEAVDGSVIRIYGGTVPATADDAITGALLCTITLNGGAAAGLIMASAPVNGVLGKDPAAAWKGLITGTGLATHYRMSPNADAAGASTSLVRIQGSVAQVGADLNFSETYFTSNGANEKAIQVFNIMLPLGIVCP